MLFDPEIFSRPGGPPQESAPGREGSAEQRADDLIGRAAVYNDLLGILIAVAAAVALVFALLP